jgi:hypothetical protein
MVPDNNNGYLSLTYGVGQAYTSKFAIACITSPFIAIVKNNL